MNSSGGIFHQHALIPKFHLLLGPGTLTTIATSTSTLHPPTLDKNLPFAQHPRWATIGSVRWGRRGSRDAGADYGTRDYIRNLRDPIRDQPSWSTIYHNLITFAQGLMMCQSTENNLPLLAHNEVLREHSHKCCHNHSSTISHCQCGGCCIP